MLKRMLLVATLSAPFALANAALAAGTGSSKPAKKSTRKSRKSSKGAKKDVKTAGEGSAAPTP
ncbi:MAG TPA: hypothetical protein VMB50_23135 [Myxococcales bacterium]|nr:hypothetical protein [Myxococcales bacterium]